MQRTVLTREDAIRYIVREWMEKNTYLPVHQLDEDGATLLGFFVGRYRVEW